MNQKQLQIFRNNATRHLKPCQKRNVININAHNSLQHEETKFRICYQLSAEGKEYVTEAEFPKGGRAGFSGGLVIYHFKLFNGINIFIC